GMLRNGIDVARSRVGVLGITFKENCPDIRNSKIVDLVRELQDWNIEVLVEDPWANPQEVMDEYDLKLDKLADQAPLDSLIVAVGHREFRSLDPISLRKLCRGEQPVLGDLKGIYDRTSAREAGFSVFRL
ncbi:MAG: UDP binding domain-containing protein, partial [Proteobacteria bacterium]|nr:UDP binding domain-containing protein [Pseudomonadota bacterium]